MGLAQIDECKRVLRTRYKQMRDELGEDCRAEADGRIAARLLAMPEYAQAEVVLTYLDFDPEVRTRNIIRAAWGAGKSVALPWCVPRTHDMRWYRVSSFDALVRTTLGVQEPVPSDEHEQLLGGGQRTIALVPGLTFDAAGCRLGYGGGFYDTFLAEFDGVSIGLCREAAFCDDLRSEGVVDAHDRSVQIVVTDRRVMRV